MDNSYTDLQSRQEVSKSMCRLTHKTQGGDKVAIAKLDKTSYKKLVQKSEKHCKTQLTAKPGCNFVV